MGREWERSLIGNFPVSMGCVHGGDGVVAGGREGADTATAGDRKAIRDQAPEPPFSALEGRATGLLRASVFGLRGLGHGAAGGGG